jgi:hypothetical protein
MHSTPQPNAAPAVGSLDGDTAADHDLPYLGFRPRASAPYPFSTRQYARLLILRGRIQDDTEASLELLPDRPSTGRQLR